MRDRYGDVVRFVPEPSSQVPIHRDSATRSKPNLPPPPIPDNHQQPSFPYHTPEEHLLWQQIGIDPNAGWNSDGIPAFTTNYRNLEPFTGEFPNNGQPPEVNKRRNWSTAIFRCDHCGSTAAYWIDRWEFRQGYYCDGCHADHKGTSYLAYELNRKPCDATISNFTGYIANDPLLKDEALWGHGIFHLGAPMGSGKTTLIYQRAREAAESGALTIIIVPRISLAQAVHAELREDTTLGWSLHHEGSEKAKPKSEKWRLGQFGAVATIGMLPHLLQVIQQRHRERTVRIFIDEIDFTSSLMLSDIFKKMSAEIKETLKAIIEAQGIVTAGQTALTIALEAIAKELNAPLKGYYTAPKIPDTTATLHIVDSHSTDQPKNRLTQAVIDQIQHLIDNTNKNVYIFCDERRTAQIIASLFPKITLLYDRYHRDSPEARDLLRKKKLPDGKKIFISSNAIDVGISIEDENAETIVLSVLNPLTVGSYDSVVQRCMRNRQKPPLAIYLLNYQNALPLSPSIATAFQSAHTNRLLNENESVPKGLIERLGRQQGMNSLVDNQPTTFISFHLKQAGFSVQSSSLDIEDFDFEMVQARRKMIKDTEDEAIKESARKVLNPETMLMESEIRQRGWESAQPAPINQLAHEHANAILRHCGWTGSVNRFVDEANTIAKENTQAFEDAGVDAEMWETARLAVGISPEKINRWKRGYIALHFPDAAASESEEKREYEPHHRHNDKGLSSLLESLLSKIPRSPSPVETIGQALIDAAQADFGYEKISQLMRNGTISPSVAKQVRFIPLGKDAPPTDRHFQFVKKFISEYYPARIAKMGDLYQIAEPKDVDEVEIFRQVVRCYINHRYPDIDDPDNLDLTPPPAPPSLEAEKAKAMKEAGKSCEEIASATGKSLQWASKHTMGVGKADPKAELKARTVQMRKDGMTLQQIAEELNISDSTVHRWMSHSSHFIHENSHIGALEGISVDEMGCQYRGITDSEPRAGTAFEADSNTRSVNGSVKTISETASRSVKTISEAILELLASGEKTTKDIVQAIDAKYNSITDELKRLVDKGEIQKPRRGVYVLIRSESLNVLDTTIKFDEAPKEVQMTTDPVYDDDRLSLFQNPHAKNFFRLSIETSHRRAELIKQRVDTQYSLEELEAINGLLTADANGEPGNTLYDTPVTDEEKQLMAEELGYFRAACLTEDPTLPDIFPPICGLPLPDFLNQPP